MAKEDAGERVKKAQAELEEAQTAQREEQKRKLDALEEEKEKIKGEIDTLKEGLQ